MSGLQQAGQVRWRNSGLGIVDNRCKFESDMFFDWESVEFTEEYGAWSGTARLNVKSEQQHFGPGDAA